MSWVLLVGIAWALLALPAALLLGHTLCRADRRELAAQATPVRGFISTEDFFAALSASARPITHGWDAMGGAPPALVRGARPRRRCTSHGCRSVALRPGSRRGTRCAPAAARLRRPPRSADAGPPPP